MKESCRILWDKELYKQQALGKKPPPIPRPSLSKDEIKKLLDYKLEKCTEKPLWGTLPFKVAEPHKNRCRAIFDCHLNNIFKETPKYSLKSKTAIRRDLARKKEYKDFIFIQFDFKGFYDQMPLHPDIRKYFGFFGFDNFYYNLRLLPMGFRLAVSTAQSAIWGFLSFKKHESVSIATCIDNVCFAGPREEVYKTAATFLERVELCNFTLHGFEEQKFTPLSESERRSVLRNLEDQTPEFLGEKYNLQKGTRAISKKTSEKLSLVWKALGPHLMNKSMHEMPITNRQFFCLIGILVYASDVLAITRGSSSTVVIGLIGKVLVLRCEALDLGAKVGSLGAEICDL